MDDFGARTFADLVSKTSSLKLNKKKGWDAFKKCFFILRRYCKWGLSPLPAYSGKKWRFGV